MDTEEPMTGAGNVCQASATVMDGSERPLLSDSISAEVAGAVRVKRGADECFEPVDSCLLPCPPLKTEWVREALAVDCLSIWYGFELAGGLAVVDGQYPWLEVVDLHVSPALRGQGMGRLLLALAMGRALARRKSHVRLTVDDNGTGRLRRWYGRLGYYPVGITTNGRAIFETVVNGRGATVPALFRLGGNWNATETKDRGSIAKL